MKCQQIAKCFAKDSLTKNLGMQFSFARQPTVREPRHSTAIGP